MKIILATVAHFSRYNNPSLPRFIFMGKCLPRPNGGGVFVGAGLAPALLTIPEENRSKPEAGTKNML